MKLFLCSHFYRKSDKEEIENKKVAFIIYTGYVLENYWEQS